jgi:hypothetical protein
MKAETDKIQLFEDQQIRTAWNETEEEWYFDEEDEDMMDSYYEEEAMADVYNTMPDAGVNEVQEYETDKDGFIIVR